MNDIALFGAVRPHTGETVRLQFKINGERVSLGWILAGEMPHLLLDSQNILHMVAQLVRDNISLRELRVAAAQPSQLIPEAKVDVDLLVRRTVEGPGL